MYLKTRSRGSTRMQLGELLSRTKASVSDATPLRSDFTHASHRTFTKAQQDTRSADSSGRTFYCDMRDIVETTCRTAIDNRGVAWKCDRDAISST